MSRVWWMMTLRPALAFALLLLLAAGYGVLGSRSAVADAAAWWLWFVTIANIVCIVLLVRFAGAEGMRLRDIYNLSRATWKGDALWFLIAIVGIALVAQAPGSALARSLWGDPNIPNQMLFRALPLAAVFPLFVLMPATQALAELPTYWGYVAPRLRASGMNRWLTIALVAAVLSVQHLFFSFQLDARYDLWLALKFLPFALWTGIVADRRPTVLPYLMFAHFLLDAFLPYLLWLVSTGMPLTT